MRERFCKRLKSTFVFGFCYVESARTSVRVVSTVHRTFPWDVRDMEMVPWSFLGRRLIMESNHHLPINQSPSEMYQEITTY